MSQPARGFLQPEADFVDVDAPAYDGVTSSRGAVSRWRILIYAFAGVLLALIVFSLIWRFVLPDSASGQTAPVETGPGRVINWANKPASPPDAPKTQPGGPASPPPPGQPTSQPFQPAVLGAGGGSGQQERWKSDSAAWGEPVAAQSESVVFDGTRPDVPRGCTLLPGANNIVAEFLGDLYSEVPGVVQAMVTQPAMDAHGYGKELIPVGSYLTGHYEQSSSINSSRLAVIWKSITFPDGTYVELPGKVPGLDIAGSAGHGGEVSVNWGHVFAAAALFTVFDVGQRSATGESGFEQDLSQAASRNAGQVGRDVARQVLDLKARIKVLAGTQFIIPVEQPVKVSDDCAY